MAASTYREVRPLGLVFVLRWNAGTWVEEALVLPADAPPDPGFGSKVALCGNTLAVASLDGDDPKHQGEVFLFEEQASGVWLQVLHLVSDPLKGELGRSVALRQGCLVIGAPADDILARSAEVLVYEDHQGAWAEAGRLLPCGATMSDATAYDHRFGSTLSLAGKRLAVGFQTESRAGSSLDCVEVFEQSLDGAWLHEAYICVPSEPYRSNAEFVHLQSENELFIVSKSWSSEEWSIHIYRRGDREWVSTQTISVVAEAEFLPYDGSVNGLGGRFFFGLPLRRVLKHEGVSGCVLEYRRNPEGWKLHTTWVPPKNSGWRRFGSALSRLDRGWVAGLRTSSGDLCGFALDF